MSKLLLKVEEAAALLSLGRSKAYELVRRGQLPSVRLGRSVRIPLAGLQNWIDTQAAVVGEDESGGDADLRVAPAGRRRK